MSRRSAAFAICMAATAAVSLLSGCTTPPESEALKVSGMYFDTIVQIEAWGATEEIMSHCEEMCGYYEQLFSPTIETSEVSRINGAGGSPVTVSDETADLIQKGIEYGELSEGLFDITIAPASSLWNFEGNEAHTVPDASELEEAVTHIDYHCIDVSGNTVTLTDPDAKIDLGAIAKGYIADQIKEYLENEGVKHALINLGGNMLALGERYDGRPFQIGLQKPFEKTGTVIEVLSVTDRSVVSSGNYERYFEKDGVIYHHILNPNTGYPIQNGLDQVTVISEQSVDGDALSTTCYALGLEKGMELIRSIEGVEAVFVTHDGEVYATDSGLLM
nr:FAD:protein FMN transferase [uncultured Mediterraneibacter sp.]